MINEDKQYLKCISCHNKLKAISFVKQRNDILEGKLQCVQCKSEWPIIKGIPRMLPRNLLMKIVIPRYTQFFLKYEGKFKINQDEKKVFEKEKIKTASSFGYEWTKYSKIIKEFEKDWIRYFSPFISPKEIKGKVVVDIGCGLAKQGYFTAKYGAKYIGVDLSEAVEAAYANTKKFNSLIVQADIYNLPLNSSKINLYYSIGVIHHLPNPREGFNKIVSVMKKGSKILIWVYGRHKNKRAIYLYNPLRSITTRIPKKLLYVLCHIPAIATHFLNTISLILEKVGAKNLARKIPFYYYTKFPYSFKHNDSFDIFATPTQKYYKRSEIKKWFTGAGIKKFTLLQDKVQGIKGFGTK